MNEKKKRYKKRIKDARKASNNALITEFGVMIKNVTCAQDFPHATSITSFNAIDDTAYDEPFRYIRSIGAIVGNCALCGFFGFFS